MNTVPVLLLTGLSSCAPSTVWNLSDDDCGAQPPSAAEPKLSPFTLESRVYSGGGQRSKAEVMMELQRVSLNMQTRPVGVALRR